MNENNNGGAGDDGKIDVANLTAEQIAEIDKAEEFILGFKDEDYNDPDKLDELKEAQKKAITTIHQKRHFREKVTELEGKLKPAAPGKPAATAPAATDDKKGVEPYQIVTFRQDNPTYAKATVEEITRIAGAFGISMEEAAASETGKAVIKSLENKESNLDAGIAPSRKSGTGLEKRDWSNATPAEMEAQRNKILTGQ